MKIIIKWFRSIFCKHDFVLDKWPTSCGMGKVEICKKCGKVNLV